MYSIRQTNIRYKLDKGLKRGQNIQPIDQTGTKCGVLSYKKLNY